ncbi:MAG: exodeoxyribonuclease III [Polyangiales bacterium]
MRLVSWNVDGLARLLRDASLADVHRTLGEPDVLALQEVRLRPLDGELLDAASAALPGFACAWSLCDDPHNGRFRGGRTYGVMTFVREALRPRWLEAPPWDREGRVLVCALDGCTVVNAYAPNGTAKPHYQDGAVLGTRSDFKLRFQRALLEHVRPFASELVMLGDWNVSRTALDVYPRLRRESPHAEARAMWNDEVLPSLELLDVFRAQHPEQRAYTWFSRGAARRDKLDAARVDYALVARSLQERVVATGIEQELAFRLGSDHAPVWLELTAPAAW